MIKSVRCFFLRLRESEINFVFCEWVLFYPLATKQYTVLFLPNSHVNLEPRVSCALHNSLPRAKDGKRQKRQGLDVLGIFTIPLVATSCTHLPLQGRQIGLILYYSARFSCFIDSLWANNVRPYGFRIKTLGRKYGRKQDLHMPCKR